MLKLARIITLEKEYLYFMRAQLMPQPIPIPDESRADIDLESQDNRANVSDISMVSNNNGDKEKNILTT